MLRPGAPQRPQHLDPVVEGGRLEFPEGRGPPPQRSHAVAEGFTHEVLGFQSADRNQEATHWIL